jgi:hypothetical protein
LRNARKGGRGKCTRANGHHWKGGKEGTAGKTIP